MSRSARAVVLQKQARALELVRDGHSYDQIARQVGYTNRGAAWRLVQNGLKDRVHELAEEHLGLEVPRLDALQAGLWEQARSGNLAAAWAVLEIIKTRSRLLRLDQPE